MHNDAYHKNCGGKVYLLKNSSLAQRFEIVLEPIYKDGLLVNYNIHVDEENPKEIDSNNLINYVCERCQSAVEIENMRTTMQVLKIHEGGKDASGD